MSTWSPDGRIAVGLKVDDEHGRLSVAGGPTGQGFVCDAATGQDLGPIPLATPGGGTSLKRFDHRYPCQRRLRIAG